MYLGFLSCTLIFSALWHGNDGSVLTENKPANHLKNISDEGLRVDLEIHDDEYDSYNWVEDYLLTKQFGKSDEMYTKEYYDNIKNMSKAKITKPEIDDNDVTVTVTIFPSEKLKIGIGANHIKNKQKAGEKIKSSSVKPICGLKTDNNTEADECDTRTKLFKVRVARIYRYALIWTSLYALVAVPFWCIKGWCCCCVRCKFFKPQETIQEAKDYLLLNPPGVLVTKKGAIIHYEPTEREKDCYEEFGHFMRTL